jgi:hypothetical protein
MMFDEEGMQVIKWQARWFYRSKTLQKLELTFGICDFVFRELRGISCGKREAKAWWNLSYYLPQCNLKDDMQINRPSSTAYPYIEKLVVAE